MIWKFCHGCHNLNYFLLIPLYAFFNSNFFLMNARSIDGTTSMLQLPPLCHNQAGLSLYISAYFLLLLKFYLLSSKWVLFQDQLESMNIFCYCCYYFFFIVILILIKCNRFALYDGIFKEQEWIKCVRSNWMFCWLSIRVVVLVFRTGAIRFLILNLFLNGWGIKNNFIWKND